MYRSVLLLYIDCNVMVLTSPYNLTFGQCWSHLRWRNNIIIVAVITWGQANATVDVIIQNLIDVQHTLSPGYTIDWDQILVELARPGRQLMNLLQIQQHSASSL